MDKMNVIATLRYVSKDEVLSTDTNGEGIGKKEIYFVNAFWESRLTLTD